MTIQKNRLQNTTQPLISNTANHQENGATLREIWELLRKQTGKKYGLDSSSIPVEQAQELLESILYTIGVAQGDNRIPELVEMLEGGLEDQFQKGRGILEKKLKQIRISWRQIYREMPVVRNDYLSDTIYMLGSYIKYYNLYYEAHQVPALISYWLLLPVSEKIKGISYAEEYIHRLQMENELVNFWNQRTLNELYRKAVGPYKTMLFNLCEPVLANAIGLTLVGGDLEKLNITNQQQQELLRIFHGKDKEEMLLILANATREVCKYFDLDGTDSERYFVKWSEELVPRIEAALQNLERDNYGEQGEISGLGNIFFTFQAEEIRV